MKISIYTYLRNGIALDYHAVQMLKHHLPLADEIVINEGYSDDGTYEAIRNLDPKIKIFDSNAFFPIDGQGFGNTPGQPHNFHFTTEIHLKFKYEAGQKFTFRGDDDLWIFVNKKLALDVGGSHQALLGTIDFDAQAALLGITAGGEYQMDIYHAERQTTESNFRIETNISCLVNVPATR